jgi:phosphoglycerate dehydrogenase-like enzyme
MNKHTALFITRRQLVHQKAALAAAPRDLEITMLRDPVREEILRQLPGKEFLIVEREGRVDSEILAAGAQLRLVQWLGSQTWNIDLEAARSRGIPVCFMPVMGCIEVAEHIVMQALIILRHTPEMMKIIYEQNVNEPPPRRSDEDTFAYNWKGFTWIQPLWKKRFGILGFGEIGCELVQRLKAFGCELSYNKRTQLPAPVEVEMGLTYSSADRISRECDLVCSLLPFSSKTDQSLGREFFAGMKAGAFFISCGGSGTVDEEALAYALRSGHLGGAALDTFTWEPLPPGSPLLELASRPETNLLLTPHVAAGTQAVGRRTSDFINIERLLTGESLINQIA